MRYVRSGLTDEAVDALQVLLLLERLGDGEVPLDGDAGEGHDLDGVGERVAEGLNGTEGRVLPGLRWKYQNSDILSLETAVLGENPILISLFKLDGLNICRSKFPNKIKFVKKNMSTSYNFMRRVVKLRKCERVGRVEW